MRPAWRSYRHLQGVALIVYVMERFIPLSLSLLYVPVESCIPVGSV